MVKFLISKFKSAQDIKKEPLLCQVDRDKNDLQDALDSVLKDRIKEQMIRACYSEEQLKDYDGYRASDLSEKEKKKKFPKAPREESRYTDILYVELNFNLNKFIKSIIK